VTTLSSPLIYAHRGASFEFPEMSREAYLAAIEQGADGFETDLRLTKDRVIVCWHDANLKRVADCDLVVADSTFAEILAAYPVLSLVELLDLALEHGKSLALETKHPVPTHGAIERELLKILAGYRQKIESAGISISIMSFSWFAISRVRRSPWNTVYLIPHRYFALFNPGRSLGPSVSVLKGIPTHRPIHRRLFVWTANSKEEILLCKEKRAAVMMTDRPAFARATLESA